MAMPAAALQRALFAPAASPARVRLDALQFTAALQRVRAVAIHTPLQRCRSLSERYGAEILLKREDLQVVRSYKLRGAYNLISQLSEQERERGVVCASAGNHAQGFAYSCRALGVKGTVFMPSVTPRQKISQVKLWGAGGAVEVRLLGDTFDDAAAEADAFCKENDMVFVHPFDDVRIIEGQGTVGLEILADMPSPPDFIFMPVGGGGLSAGVGAAVKTAGAGSMLVGVEPEGAPSMLHALRAGKPVRLPKIDTFIDGAAVKRVGDVTFDVVSRTLDAMHLVPEGRVCSTLLSLYNTEAMVVEPAGALSIAALEDFADVIRGKRVVCIVSGSNADVDRLAEVRERSLQYEGLKHYFLLRFAQRPGALKDFVTFVLPEGADIVRFEYLKRSNRESGPALVGLEIARRSDYDVLLRNIKRYGMDFTEVGRDDTLAQYLI